ncbi:CAP domain-containing protein [Terrabacter terrigena]|uniref:CAP domain-containing protein n=1 Tax=Terrabacter terrigena TaxID=574718 RepID=A0ABW3MU40_9MICO
MGRHTDPADPGSRRAVILTLTASALLVLAGVVILRSAGDLRLGHAGPGPSPTSTPTSTIGELSAPAPGPLTSPTPATSSVSPPTGQLPTRVREAVAEQVVSLVNAERARAGCAPVATHALLARAAQDHSADMAARSYFSHTSPDGRTFAQRIRAAGWAGGALAENIAAGQVSAMAVMQAWMGSAAHRANILNCAYRDIGVGYATGGRYGTYWTQAFGA